MPNRRILSSVENSRRERRCYSSRPTIRRNNPPSFGQLGQPWDGMSGEIRRGVRIPRKYLLKRKYFIHRFFPVYHRWRINLDIQLRVRRKPRRSGITRMQVSLCDNRKDLWGNNGKTSISRTKWRRHSVESYGIMRESVCRSKYRKYAGTISKRVYI